MCRKRGKKAAKEEVAAIAVVTDSEELGKEVDAMPQFKQLGKRFKTTAPVALTDEGLEYVVTCIKHIYKQHIVLQFTCMNTFKEQVRCHAVGGLKRCSLLLENTATA